MRYAAFALLLLSACHDLHTTGAYTLRELHGLEIYVSPEAFAHKEDHTFALEHLDQALAGVKRTVGMAHWDAVPKKTIWLEWNRSNFLGGNGLYFPSADSATRSGYNGDKARSIVIESAVRVATTDPRIAQRTLLHEFAHAFHHQVLGFDNKMVSHCYKQAKANGTYGATYASTNEYEYFAMLTEFFFGAGTELLRDGDKCGFALMRKVWKPEAMNVAYSAK